MFQIVNIGNQCKLISDKIKNFNFFSSVLAFGWGGGRPQKDDQLQSENVGNRPGKLNRIRLGVKLTKHFFSVSYARQNKQECLFLARFSGTV